ncbi:MAG: cell wall-binding repeat-containing protein [Actinomycetota bacterium]|nr:cell wall-binding repeat-containing protein [Actinomycetota bacterium]
MRIARSTPLATARLHAVRPARVLACALTSAALSAIAFATPGTAGAAPPAAGLSRANVPIEHSTQASLPSDSVQVRIAMTENDTSVLVVASPGGLVATGAPGAKAVMYTPTGTGSWSVATGTGCGGPWVPLQGNVVQTPLVRPASTGTLLTLCADDHTQLQVQGVLQGVYNSAGQARTVNTLPLEQYVADVVPAESISDWGNVGGQGPQGRPWGFQALEAQAVAVRSYVLASPGGYGGYATACDLTCQTYRGTEYLTANSTAAAQGTAGQVMEMLGGAIAATEYSASTGGYTSSSAEGSPFTPVPDAGDAVCLTPGNPGLCNTNHDWSVTIPLSTVHAHWPKEGTSPVVEVTARNGYGTWGGRATELTISGNGTSQTVPAATFVAAFNLESNYFTITQSPGQPLALTGHGWGHGIGMGQWGAFGYAVGTDGGAGNWTWQQIVEHYYAPATIATLPGTAATFADTRISGPTADATAAQELEHQFTPAAGSCPGSGPTRPVVLATDAGYPDALASAPLARALGTGTLLTPTTRLSSVTATALRAEGVTHVYVVGGPLAISTSVVTTIEGMPVHACGGGTASGGDIEVTRLFGQTQYDTAAQVATEAAKLGGVGAMDLSGAYQGTNATGGDGRYNATAGSASRGPAATGTLTTAVVARGTGFQDAETASTLAYAERLPILLTTPSTLSPQVASAVRALGVRQVVVMGGELAVSNGVVASLAQLGLSVLRVAGADATGTAVELAQLEEAPSPTGAGWQGTGELTVARGNGYSDGLAGAVVAADGPGAGAPAPLVLTETPSTVGAALTAYLQLAGTTGIGGMRVTDLTVLGGTLAVTQTAVDQMGKDLTG